MMAPPAPVPPGASIPRTIACADGPAGRHRPEVSFRASVYAYTAFGTHYVPKVLETISQRYTFTGREASQASAAPMYYRYRMYSPSLGRFGRRDPEGSEASLPNTLYAYAANTPTVNVDPYGLVVTSQCPLERHLQDVGIKEESYTRKPQDLKAKGPFEYSAGKAQVDFSKSKLEFEIVMRMIISPRRFTVDGDTPKGCLKNLDDHTAARKRVADAAIAVRFQFSEKEKLNEKVWNVVWVNGFEWREDPETGKMTKMPVKIPHYYPRKPGQLQTACDDMWSRRGADYRVGCAMGMEALAVHAIIGLFDRETLKERLRPDTHLEQAFLRLTTEGAFRDRIEVPDDDWIPGDSGYINNGKFRPGASTPGTEGENVVYVGMRDGKQRWWGLSRKKGGELLPLTGEGSWFRIVEGWDGNASIVKKRRYPRIGLHIGELD